MKNEKLYYVKQKLLGAALVLCGIIAAIILDGNITASIMLVPMGVYVICTKEKVMYKDDNDEDEEEEL